jgi:hypothetical protein
MIRIIASLALTIALAIAGSVAFDMLRGPEPTAVAAKSAGLKTCRAKMANGRIKTWRCGKDQPCCVNDMMGLYVCGSPIIGCL